MMLIMMFFLLLGMTLFAIAEAEPLPAPAPATFLSPTTTPIRGSQNVSNTDKDSDNDDSHGDSMVRFLATSTTTVNVEGVACTGDDCFSEAECPAGTSIIDCESEPANSGDGIQVESGKCVARGAPTPSNRRRRRRRHYVKAIASCSSAPTSVVASSTIFLDNQEISAACRNGNALNCYCHSAWTSSVCGGTTEFAPSGATCKKTIGASSGRRRMEGLGAGAIVYALCLDATTTTLASTPAPTLVCTSVPPTWQQCETDQRCGSYSYGDPARAGCESYCASRCR